MKILIVDDEEPARARLLDLLREIDPEIAIAEAENGKAALQMAGGETFDLVLMDIRMPVMNGLEAAYHLSRMQPAPAVVFTTAYQDHALAAFEANAVDYLLKPIRRDRLKQAMGRARMISRARMENVLAHEPERPARGFLVATNGRRTELVPVEEISYFKAEEKYVMAGCGDREIVIEEPIKSLEDEFGDRFLRIHRNALVAMAHIGSLQREPDGSVSLSLRDSGVKLTVSRRHLPEVRKAIRRMVKGN
jgi:two-component system, LytTR family, response regulator AlgR